MKKKEVRAWKKVFKQDLGYIAYELRELVNTPAFIMLEGDLGAGKTTFSKVFLGEEDTMSPTYSVLYEKKDALHGDFYRVNTREEVIRLELPLYLEDKNFFLAEWSEKLYEAIDPELDEEFSSYILEISVNEKADSDGDPSRNFLLSSIS